VIERGLVRSVERDAGFIATETITLQLPSERPGG
jgi:hypothetical protein